MAETYKECIVKQKYETLFCPDEINNNNNNN